MQLSLRRYLMVALAAAAACSVLSVAAGTATSRIPVAHASGGDCATLASQGDYPTVAPGQSILLWINVRNCGSSTWTPSAGFGYLGQGQWSSYGDRPLWRVVSPGDILSFSATVTAPSSSGVYRYGFLVTHGGASIGPYFFIDVTVRAREQHTYMPSTIGCTHTDSWHCYAEYNVGADVDPNGWWSPCGSLWTAPDEHGTVRVGVHWPDWVAARGIPPYYAYACPLVHSP